MPVDLTIRQNPDIIVEQSCIKNLEPHNEHVVSKSTPHISMSIVLRRRGIPSDRAPKQCVECIDAWETNKSSLTIVPRKGDEYDERATTLRASSAAMRQQNGVVQLDVGHLTGGQGLRC
jgi:hypothetical protein